MSQVLLFITPIKINVTHTGAIELAVSNNLANLFIASRLTVYLSSIVTIFADFIYILTSNNLNIVTDKKTLTRTQKTS